MPAMNQSRTGRPRNLRPIMNTSAPRAVRQYRTASALKICNGTEGAQPSWARRCGTTSCSKSSEPRNGPNTTTAPARNPRHHHIIDRLIDLMVATDNERSCVFAAATTTRKIGIRKDTNSLEPHPIAKKKPAVSNKCTR